MSNFDPIVIPVTIDDTTVSPQMKNIGNVVETEANRGALGAKGMGVAFKDLGRYVGVTGAASRLFGSEVTSLALSLGTGAGAIGAVTIAAMIGYKIYENFSEATKKHREELEKATSSALSETTALYANKLETEGVRKAKLELAKANREIYLYNNAELIKAETIELDQLLSKARQGIGFFQKMWINLQLGGGIGDLGGVAMAQEEINNQEKKFGIEIDQTIRKKQAELNITKELQNAASVAPKTFITDESNPFWQQDQQKVWLTSMHTDYLTARGYQIEYDKSRLEMAKATGASMAEVHTMELVVFDETTSRMILAAKNRDEADAIFSRRANERVTNDANYAINVKKQEINTERQLNDYKLNSATSFLTALDAVTRGKYKAIFLGIQAMSASSALIHGWAAAAAAIAPPPIGLGPVAGAPLAVWAKAEGVLAATAIMAQAFMGGSSSGGGSTGIYSANPNTGLPTSQVDSSAGPNVYISIDGGKTYDKIELAGEVMKSIYNQNGSIGGLSVNVSRSA